MANKCDSGFFKEGNFWNRRAFLKKLTAQIILLLFLPQAAFASFQLSNDGAGGNSNMDADTGFTGAPTSNSTGSNAATLAWSNISVPALGNEDDLCTGPKYSGQADIIGRFFNHKFLFPPHQKYEFKPSSGEDSKLPLTSTYPQINKILKLNITPEQAETLPTDRIIKIKIDNYQAYCEGLPEANYVSIDSTFNNAEGHWILVNGNSSPGFIGDIDYAGEETIRGFLRSIQNAENQNATMNFLEVDPKDQSLLPLRDWQKFIPKFNTTVIIQNGNERKQWLIQNKDRQVVLTIDHYGFNAESASQIRIKTNFADVYNENTFAEAIQFLKTHNIVEGYSDGTFHPERSINRAEFAKIALLTMFAQEDIPDAENCFADVKNEWFSPYVCALKSGGVVQGYGEGSGTSAEPSISTLPTPSSGSVDPSTTISAPSAVNGSATSSAIKFFPQNKITIAEALKILMKMADIQYDQTLLWSDGVLAKADEIGLLDNLLVEDGNTPLTRGEMAEIIMRMLRL